MSHPILRSSLLDIISAPSELIGFEQILANLIHILPYLPKLNESRWPGADVQDWVLICKDALAHQEKFRSIKNFNYIEKTKGSGLRNYLKSHSLYSALWTSPPEDSNQNAYYHLQAHLINSHDYLKNNRTDENIESIQYESALAVRRITTKTKYLALLDQLPSQPQETKKLQIHVLGLLNSEQGKSYVSLLRVIERMLAYTLNIRNPHSKHVHQNIPVIEDIKIESETIDPDSEIESSPIKLFRSSTILKNEAVEARKEGNADDENFSGPSYITDNEPIEINSGESPESNALTIKLKSRAIARNNQQLPMRWDRLNLHEIYSLYSGLHLLHTDNFDEIDGEYHCQLTAIVSVMHWTSSSFERAINTRILSSIKYIPSNYPEEQIYICIKEREWVICKPNLDQRKSRTGWNNYLEDSSLFIQHSINPLFWELIASQVEVKAAGIRTRSRNLFDSENANLHTNLNSFLSILRKKYHSRLTKMRVSSHIYDLLIDQTGDVADACLITGRIPTMGQKAALYYYCPLLDYLKDKYRITCNKVEKVITDQIPFKLDSFKPNVLTNKNKRIGSKICPLEKTVALLVSDLKRKVAKYRKNHLEINFLIKFHNAYTAYCVLMIGFATGYRAVRDPFYSETEVDEETGFLVISDKDGDDYYNSRLVWLPPVCLRQIKEYSKHRNSLASNLVLVNPELAKVLLHSIKPSWSRSEDQDIELPFFFFLNADFKKETVKPVSLHEEIRWITDIPLNANRHYLRTRLRELELSGEFIDAFMGHWEKGQEPYGDYSTLSPLSYIDALRKPLEILLHNAGWVVTKGIHG